MAGEENVFIDGGTAPTSASAQVAQAIAAHISDVQQRVEVGAVVGEVEGMAVRQRRNSSMVRYNGVELPERTPVYDRAGRLSMVPTAQLLHHLTKNGGAFTVNPPPGVEPEKYIEGTCQWCVERSLEQNGPERVVRKRFRTETARRAHYRSYHPDEYAEEREEGQRPIITTAMIRDAISSLSREEIEDMIEPKRGRKAS